MPSAPVVLRYGHVVAHINQIEVLPDVLAALVSTDAATAVATTEALSAHEAAISVARSAGLSGSPGKIAQTLKSMGHGQLANRVRSSARSRGATAHPDISLPQDLSTALSAPMPFLLQMMFMGHIGRPQVCMATPHKHRCPTIKLKRMAGELLRRRRSTTCSRAWMASSCRLSMRSRRWHL